MSTDHNDKPVAPEEIAEEALDDIQGGARAATTQNLAKVDPGAEATLQETTIKSRLTIP